MIKHQFEPSNLECGQAVLGMITDTDAKKVSAELNNRRETKLIEMRNYLIGKGYEISEKREIAKDKEELPPLCLLSLETPICWHWSLYCKGTFYDPQYGVLSDWPPSKRRYYWKIEEKQR